MPSPGPTGKPSELPKMLQGSINSFREISRLHASRRGNVYRAVDTTTGRSVVLKTAHESVADGQRSASLRNEYRILSQITSDFVPRAIEYGRLATGSYLALDYSDGVSLLEHLKGHRMSIKEFLLVAPQIVHALSDIHESGVIHKNISPANIIYESATQKIAIIDFGIATEFSRERSSTMESNAPEGSIWYISPEQTGRMNHTVDFRTDFYSLGATFFEMLCGRRPFESDSYSQIIHMHLAMSPPQANTINSDVPEMLSRLVSTLMAKMPADRYQKDEGISFDLGRCLKNLQSGTPAAHFELGTADYTDHLEMPQKTYGREAEIAILIESHRGAQNGNKELVSIAGHSGIGKTTLVGELHGHLAASDSIFIYGKYDQYHRHTPYGAVSQALEQFCDFVLSESTESVEAWKARIAAALKKDGRLLVDRVPKLALLAGEPEPLADLPPLEERTRFKAALQDLLAGIASGDRTLVVFFDDVHLADTGSFELIEEIMSNERIGGFLGVLCYRDNEVDDNHPLILSIDRMSARGVKIRQIALAGLAPESATRMIADSLRCDAQSVADLARATYGKTNGNPFYVRQFLRHCHDKGYVRFDHGAKAWTWDTAAVGRCEAEENVVDFLVRNLAQLPQATRSILSLAACVGRTFKVETLARISGKESDAVLQDLKQAVTLEIAHSLSGRSGMGGEADFGFSHDRFQQAFYMVLSDEERRSTHLRLARYYEALGYGEDASSERQFILADSYANAFALLPQGAERRRAAEVLLKTAKAASVRSAFGTALRYLELIVGWLTEFRTDGAFELSVYSEYHSALCSKAKYVEADAIYSVLQDLAKEPIQLTDCCCLQAISLSNRGRYKDAFMLGVELLGKLGVDFPAENLQVAVACALGEFYSELGGEAFPGVEHLPKSNSVVESSIAKILNRISTAGLFHNAFSAFWAIITNAKRVLENGYTQEGLPLYGSLTLLLIPFRNDYHLSYDLALGAMRLAEKSGYRVYRMYHLFSLVNSHWYDDCKTSISYARESCRGNTASGDFEFACFSYFTTQQLMLETCSNLVELVEETKAALGYAEGHGNLHAQRSFISFRQFSRALMGTGAPNGSFDDGEFSESAHLGEIASNQMALCFFCTLRALSAAIYSDFGRVFELTERAIPFMPSITGFYFTALHRFLHSLSICKRIESGSCTQEERTALIGKLTDNQKWLSERGADAPANFMHLFHLIEAERTALTGEPAELISLYEKAMAGARRNGRPYHYAIACDLAAQRCLALRAPVTTAGFFREACHSFEAWGAKGKVQQMRQKFIGYSLFDFERTKRLSTFPVASVAKPFDFNSLILASQAISRETQIEAVFASLMNVLLENAGAQNIYYLTEKSGVYSVMAESHAEGGTVVVSRGKPAAIDSIPTRIVNYAARARETVVLDNAATSESYGTDEYIAKHGCKSVMCIPIVSKSELKGLLYLENNLIEGAFDEQRIDALNTIAAQLAISLENAYLFNNLQQLVDERTRELRDEIAIRKDAERQKELMIADLRKALEKVKLLSGLLPICASCKKIRDDKGYWNRIEEYIREHSEAQFSHGICPDCLRRLYPEIADDCDEN